MGLLEFGTLSRRVGAGATRRGAVRMLAGGLGTAIAAQGPGQAAAKKKKKKFRCSGLPAQALCNTSADCCTGSTQRVCSQNYCGESDEPVCCGGVGAACQADCDCCGEQYCGGSGKCIYGVG